MNVSIELCLSIAGLATSVCCASSPAPQVPHAAISPAVAGGAKPGAKAANVAPRSAVRPGAAPRVVEWVSDLDAALEQARATGKLVLVCFNMDGEQANERALAMYRSAQFGKAGEQVLCVMCSADKHAEAGSPCPRFGGCDCRTHMASEKQARRRFFGDSRDNIAPQHILLYPDGLLAWHAVYEVDPAEVCRAIEGAQRLKSQPLAQRARAQRSQLSSLRTRAAKGGEAFLQVQAILAQTPIEHFLEALQALEREVGEKVLTALATHPRAQALPRLQAALKHSHKAVRQTATTLVARVQAMPDATNPVVTPAPAVETKPLAESLPVLGPGQSLDRVHWVGTAPTLAGQRNRLTLLWFFRLDAEGLGALVAEMNEFAQQVAAEGIDVLGVACDLRPSDTTERLTALRCEFPVGAYAPALRLCGVERFPSWVVLDPETNIVHRSPQDGASFDWLQARTLVRQMAVSPSYRARLTQGN